MHKFLKPIFSFIALAIITTTGYSQEVTQLSLDQCIDIALKNNINLQVSENNAHIANSNKTQALLNFLPGVTANVDYSFTFGNFWDNSAARQVSETTERSNPWVSADIVIFNGLNNHYNLKQRSHQFESAQYGVESSKINLKNNIYSSYLSVILDKENIKISEDRIQLLSAQLDREEKRESVGVGNMESVYNFRSQLANEKLNKVSLVNQYKRDKLQLIQLLRLDISKEYTFEPIEPSLNDQLLNAKSFDEVLEGGINYSPSIKQANANYEASLYGLKIAKAQRYPRLTGSAALGSNFSSNGAWNPSNGEFNESADYFTQMDWNTQQQISLNLRIPIFTRFNTETQIQTAKLNMLNAELNHKQAELDATNALQNVYLDMLAAQETYAASVENLKALEQSFEFINRRYETGNTDFFTYLESLNNKNRAEVELVNAKYSIIFRKKILDLLQGQ